MTRLELGKASASIAIFRVSPAAGGFVFTRTLSGAGVSSCEKLPELFGPYGTERAAHELARRAAARFRMQSPGFIVGVVGIEPEPEPGASAHPLPKADAVNARRAADTARSKARYAKLKATPEGRELLREKQRRRYVRLVATPEGREQMRERWRRKRRPAASPFVCEDEKAGIVPTCIICGKPTHYYHGRAVRFCSKKPGEKRSLCNTQYTAQVMLQNLKDDPEKRKARRSKDRETRRNNPERHAKRLAQQQKYRDRRRADSERRARQKEYKREYNARLRADPVRREQLIEANRQRYARTKTDPVLWSREKERRQKRYDALRADLKAWFRKLEDDRRRWAINRGQRECLPEQPTGSVLLTASARAPGHDLLASIYSAVSPRLPPDLRMEIISETAVLVLEGIDLTEAVNRAGKSVRKNAAQLRYTKPIEDCFWLADEPPPSFSEADL